MRVIPAKVNAKTIIELNHKFFDYDHLDFINNSNKFLMKEKWKEVRSKITEKYNLIKFGRIDGVYVGCFYDDAIKLFPQEALNELYIEAYKILNSEGENIINQKSNT